MGLWERLPARLRHNGEQVLWEGHAAVSTAAVVNGEMVPIDVAGVDLGFVVLTDRQLVIGHLTKLMKRIEVWDSFDTAVLQPETNDPRGVAFKVNQIGPVDLVVTMPSRDLEGLRRAASRIGD